MIKIVSGTLNQKELKTEEIEGDKEEFLKIISNLQKPKMLLSNQNTTTMYCEYHDGTYQIISLEG